MPTSTRWRHLFVSVSSLVLGGFIVLVAVLRKALPTEPRTLSEAMITTEATQEGTAITGSFRALRARALDPATSIEDKAGLFKDYSIWSEQLGDDADPEVFREMVWVLENAMDPDHREDTLQGMGRVRDPLVVDAVLACLQLDDEEGVREEAAEVLANFRAEPRVRRALEAAARSDPREDVRATAIAALER